MSTIPKWNVDNFLFTTEFTKKAQRTQRQNNVFLFFLTFVKTFETFVVNGFRPSSCTKN
jgi:hypothetical protein